MARTVVVFGAGGALGAAVVARLRADGDRVVAAVSRRPAEPDPGLAYVEVDALDEATVAAAFDGLGPAAVVNLIGGYTPPQPLASLDLSVLRTQLDVNLMTAAAVTKHALPALAAAGGGALVHTSSRVATQSGEGGFAYSVSKLAVIRLVEAGAAEGRADGVRVNCVLPSLIDTPANRAAMPRSDHDRWPKASEIAAVIAFLTSDDSRLVSGASIPVYGLA